MAKAHEELKAYLINRPGKAFAVQLTCMVYPWATPEVTNLYIRYRVFEELTIRYDTGELTRKKLKKMDHYRFDAVFFIQPGKASLNQSECLTVGVELKNSKEDLKYDAKMEKYFGWTDLFFIGVPESLAPEAIRKAEEVSMAHFGTVDMVGVLAVDTGMIYKIPVRRQEVSPANRIAVYEQIIYNQIFNETATVGIALEEVEELSRLPEELALNTSAVHIAAIPDSEAASADSSVITPPNNDGLNTLSESKNEIPPNDDGLNTALTEEERAARYAAAKARQDVRKAAMEELSERAAKLSEEARGSLMALPLKHQQVFWAISDAKSPIQAGAVRQQLGFGLNTLDRATSALLACKLIAREGSKKSGGYVVTPLGQCGAECGTCAIALSCPQHQPVYINNLNNS